MRTRGSDLSLRIADTPIPGWMVAATVLFVCFFAGLSLAWIPPEVVFGLTVIGVLAFISVRRPYAGLIIYLCMEYLRPTERYPALAPLHLTRVVAIFVLIGWLVRRRRDGFELWVNSAENGAMMAFVFAAALSVPFSFWKMIAFDTTIDVARMAIVFVLTINLVNTPGRLAGFMLAYILLNVFVSAEQLFHYGTAPVGPEGLVRVGGAGSFLGEDGDFAMAMSVALPFVYYLTWTGVHRVTRILAGLASTMLVASVVATGSRGGALGLCSVLLLLALRSRNRLLAMLVIIGVVGCAWVLAPPQYTARISTIVASHGQDMTARSRMVSWKAARQMFLDHPVTGVGAGNFVSAFVGKYGGAYSWSRNTHNVFYQAAAELGICGLVPFLFMVVCIFRRAIVLNYRIVRRPQLASQPIAAYVAALLPSMAGFVVAGSFQTPLYYPHIYLIAALGVALNNIARPQLGTIEAKEAPSKWNPERLRALR